MNKNVILIACQAFLCAIAAYLVSKISFLGKVGIAVFYREYSFLRSGWKTFLLFFVIQLVLILLLNYALKRVSKKTMKLLGSALFFTGLIALWATYYDFQYTFAHRLLKERFHLGFYLFWIGWMSTCIYFMMQARNIEAPNMQAQDILDAEEIISSQKNV